MKLRRALSYAALGIGAAAATNEVLQREAGELPPALTGMQRTFRWRGMNVAYTEKGNTSDPTIILLHGVSAAGSSGEFREIFDRLAESHHVVAPDLPGFGRSERPPLRYSAALYEDFVTDFLGDFTGGTDGNGDGPTVVASSLTGAYAAAAAREVDLGRLVLVCPTTTAGPEPPKAWVRELIRLPVVGEIVFNAICSKAAIRYFNADHGYASPDFPTEEWEAYEWRTTHQKNARFAPASFVAGDLNSDLDLGAALADADCEVDLVWGRETDVTPLSDGEDLAEEADCRLVVFDDAKLLPHVEWPEQFTDLVEGRLPSSEAIEVENEGEERETVEESEEPEATEGEESETAETPEIPDATEEGEGGGDTDGSEEGEAEDESEAETENGNEAEEETT